MTNFPGSLPILGPDREYSLWEQRCADDCVLWSECGGSSSAPCICVWTAPDKRFKCTKCRFVCRERRDVANPRTEFLAQMRAGLGLEHLRISPSPTTRSLPILIPTRTNELAARELPLRWIAVDAKTLFTRHRRGPVQTRPFLNSPAKMRETLRASASTRLLAVLNGRDLLLEGFWGMPRRECLLKVREAGFSAVTGPTFSITSEDATPASHNICMLRRHHRVVQEIEGAALLPIPNLYWRAPIDLQQWKDWFAANPMVNIVSRDFSRTKDKRSFQAELGGLFNLLAAIGRPLHILLVGVGVRKAREAFIKLSELACTCSLVTASPVMQAIKRGQEFSFRVKGQPTDVFNPAKDRFDLALANIQVMEEYLLEITADLPGYGASEHRNWFDPVEWPEYRIAG